MRSERGARTGLSLCGVSLAREQARDTSAVTERIVSKAADRGGGICVANKIKYLIR